MSDILLEMLEKRALDELIYSTMHAMDANDWVAYRKGILDDAEFDFTEHGVASEDASEIMKGADYFISTLESVLGGFEATQHHVTNMIHRIDGDTARTDCYVYAEHFLNNDRGDRSVTCGGRYQVDSLRTADGWKVKKWKYYVSWFRGNTMLYKYASERAAKNKDKQSL